jgi:membrane-associated phospholipid phosphatase
VVSDDTAGSAAVPLDETAGRVAAAPDVVPRSAFRLSFNLDAPLLLIGGAVASSFLFLNETAPPACAPLCDRSQVNAFDRPFAGLYSPRMQTLGDLATAATILLVPAGLLVAEPSRGGLGDLLVVGEAALLTSAVQVPVSYAVGRPRPRVYGEKAPLAERDDANAGRSFFSGHAANCLAVTMVTTTALRRTHHRRLAWTVLAVGLTGSVVVGIARVGAGGHFPSDVLVGYAVGAGVGIAVPALHAANFEVRPLADAQIRGLAIAHAF